MKTTQQPLEMTIRNGTLFINENIQIEFAEAFLKLPEQAKDSYEFHSDKTPVKKEAAQLSAAAPKKNTGTDADQVRELIKDFLSEGPTKLQRLSSMIAAAGHEIKYSVLNNICWNMKKKGELFSPGSGVYALFGKVKKAHEEKKKVTKEPKTAKAKVVVNVGQNSEIKKMITEYLTENGPKDISDILEHVQEVHPDITKSYIKNIFYNGKKDGSILNPDRGIYSVPKGKSISQVVSVEIVKGGLPPMKAPASVVAPEVEEEEEEPQAQRVYQTYKTGDNILEGDEIQVLSPDARTDDDILNFPEDVAEQFGTITRCDEGSSMVNVRINRTGSEILVYPHWIRLAQRGELK